MIQKLLNSMGYDIIRLRPSKAVKADRPKGQDLTKESIDFLNKASSGKKIIVYGDKNAVKQFKFHFDIAYCVSDDIEGICLGESMRSVYDLSYEKPQSFFVLVIQPSYNLPKIFTILTSIGLFVERDYYIITRRPNYDDRGKRYRDSYLGYNRVYNEYNNKYPGFKINGNVDDESLRIVVLGNSTTDPMLDGIMSWPEALYYILKNKDINATVFNGGFVAYTSSSEVLKFVRDVIHLHPDIVISYSGLNDFTYDISDKSSKRYKRYFISEAQADLYDWISNKERKFVLHGVRTNKTPVKYWVDNQRIMNSISEGLGIKYVGILQANIYSSGIPSEFLEGTLKAKFGNNNRFKEIFYQYHRLKSSYDEAEQEIANIPYILNFRHIFDGINDYDIYYDYAHVYERGTQFIAANVFKNLLDMGYLR